MNENVLFTGPSSALGMHQLGIQETGVNRALLPWEESRQTRDGERLEILKTEDTMKERERAFQQNLVVLNED